MRRFATFLLAFLIFFAGSKAFAATDTPFYRTLSLGSSGADVYALQKILNRDPSTAIAETGPGSKGQETSYFGALTKAAVIRFQEKYAGDILTPVGLMQGNGYVGLYTRTKLNALSVPATSINGDPVSVTPPSATSPAVASSTTASHNPNLENADKLMARLDLIAARRGISSSTLAAIKQSVMQSLSTTTDLRAAFFSSLRSESSKKTAQNNSLFGRALAALGRAFDNLFEPKRAYAANSVPFGGALGAAFYCTQSQTWYLYVEPLPPSYVAALSYIPFSQAFSSYNTPSTNWLLGFYAPGAGNCVQGACPYCIFIPSEGIITPMLGSSPS